MKTYTVVVDLGKKRDRTTFLVWRAKQATREIEGVERSIWAFVIVHLALFQGVPYHEVVASLAALMGHSDLMADSDLLVDGQNVGEAVIEMMRTQGLSPIPIITTGGQTVRKVKEQEGYIFGNRRGKLIPLQTFEEIHVPKNDLVEAARKLSRQNRITLARGLRWEDEFKKQLRDFHGIQSTRSTRYEAEDEATHDDFAWCLLAAAWWCTRGGVDDEAAPEPVGVGAGKLPDWNPLDFI